MQPSKKRDSNFLFQYIFLIMVEKSIMEEEKRAVMQYNKDKKLCLLTQYIEVFIEWNKTCNSHVGLYLSLF